MKIIKFENVKKKPVETLIAPGSCDDIPAVVAGSHFVGIWAPGFGFKLVNGRGPGFSTIEDTTRRKQGLHWQDRAPRNFMSTMALHIVFGTIGPDKKYTITDQIPIGEFASTYYTKVTYTTTDKDELYIAGVGALGAFCVKINLFNKEGKSVFPTIQHQSGIMWEHYASRIGDDSLNWCVGTLVEDKKVVVYRFHRRSNEIVLDTDYIKEVDHSKLPVEEQQGTRTGDLTGINLDEHMVKNENYDLPELHTETNIVYQAHTVVNLAGMGPYYREENVNKKQVQFSTDVQTFESKVSEPADEKVEKTEKKK